MLWLKAFHLIFMVTWFAGLFVVSIRTSAFLAGSFNAARQASEHLLTRAGRVRGHPWPRIWSG
jgi:uncharacterized membrane protein